MSGKVLGLMILSSVLFSCSDQQTKPAPTPMPPSAPASVVLEEPHYQQSDLLELQKQVDLGHQPWRLEPDQVAIVFLKKYIKETVRSEPIVKRNTEQEVEVEVSTDKEKFSVALRRFREKYGIWYVTRILRE